MTLYFVGTGPGDPNLITVKGAALLQEADAIVANAVAVSRFLRGTPAQIHDIGGYRLGNRRPQAEVNALLIDLARQHDTVVRLWEGDPFVFCQTAEEMAAARAAGIRVAVVPGVSSAIAAPAFAGVPVTHWDYASAFAVVSGFDPPASPARPNWESLAGVATLVILMPLENLAATVDKLLQAGKPPDTKTLLIQQGTLPQQQHTVTTLDRLVETAATFREPVVIVLGEVVQLTEQLGWFQPEGYPLLGQRVLVTRPIRQAMNFTAALRDLGAEPVAFPTIEIIPAEDTAPLDAAIQQLDGYDWLVLTSVNGVDAFWQGLARAGLDSRALASVQVAAIGPATAGSMQQRSITPDLMPEVYTAEGVLDAFDALGSVAGQRFLLARADIARKTLAEELVARGASVDEVATYRTVPRADGVRPPVADIVTFTSSSTVQGYVNCLQGIAPADFLQDTKVVCIGPITARTATELGVPVTAMADEYTIPGLLDALRQL